VTREGRTPFTPPFSFPDPFIFSPPPLTQLENLYIHASPALEYQAVPLSLRT